MMALLPWRLWAADAMALQVVTPPCHAAMATDTMSHHNTGNNSDSAGAEPSAHALCNICHGSAAEPSPALTQGSSARPDSPQHPAHLPLHSVLRAPDLRPPITC